MLPTIIIPAYQPDSRLLELLEALMQLGENSIVIVNDGSDADLTPLFNRAELYTPVKVLVHPQNRGKGAALRTGFNYLLEVDNSSGAVITADADGQHTAEDIIKISRACSDHPGHLVLGARQFDNQVPLRSRFGNTLTRLLYNFLFRQRLSDTQTGLRGIPTAALEDLLLLESDRYNYELEMLLCLQRAKIPILEVPILTIYEENNSSSHFRPLYDSLEIYTTLFKWWLKIRRPKS